MTPEPAAASAAAPTRSAVPLQTRGAVQPGALYVARPIDDEVLAALRAGQWALVQGPRCCGKSSLRVRLASALAAEIDGTDGTGPGCRVAVVDTRSLQAASVGAAYLALCNAVAVSLKLPAAGAFWQRGADAPPAARWVRYLREEVATTAAHTVVLLDDLDGLAELPIELPEFLLSLRQLRDELTSDGAATLTVALFSSLYMPRLLASAADSAFGDGELFPLLDFTRAELAAFAPALASLVQGGSAVPVDAWLDALEAWTSGHPQLTQHLCQQLVARGLPAEAPRAPTEADEAPAESGPGEHVERLVHLLFLDGDAPTEVMHEALCPRDIVEALGRSPQAQALIALYQRLLSGAAVTPDPLDALQQELWLAGLCTESEDLAGTPRLRPRCRLLAALFSDGWAREQQVRLLLQDAVARNEAGGEAGGQAALLRGSQLKIAQAWARRHPEALRPAELRVLLASLEAARTEAEGKHQASAAALQRELRGRADTPPGRVVHPAPPTPIAGGRASLRPAWAAIAILGVLCSALLVRAHRHAARSEQALRVMQERAERAERMLQTLPAARPLTPGAPPPSLARPRGP